MDRPSDRDEAALARAYYAALDDHDYEALASVLAAEFVHDRPDRTFEGRERFVAFMRDERPRSETSHPIDSFYRPLSDAAGDVVVAGRLLDGAGEEIVRFLDVFFLDDGRIRRIETYTR